MACLPQMDEGKGVGVAVGGSAVEELGESVSGVTSGGGRKKKKKHKSGEDLSASAKSSAVVADDELVDAVLPMLSDNQGSGKSGQLVLLADGFVLTFC